MISFGSIVHRNFETLSVLEPAAPPTSDGFQDRMSSDTRARRRSNGAIINPERQLRTTAHC
jgi:hypothetical protein